MPVVIVAIIGSRKFADYKYLSKRCTFQMLGITNVCRKKGFIPDWRIISGGATGADALGKRYANEFGYSFEEYLPRFKVEKTPYRGRDYYDRDVLIAKMCHVLLAFLVKEIGQNRGSKITIEEAINQMKQVHVFYK